MQVQRRFFGLVAALGIKQVDDAFALGFFGNLANGRLALIENSPAHLAVGVENYMLSLKAAPLRVLLRLTGSNVDREKGLEELRETAAHGHYLEPFAKLLLAVAALRENNPVRARELLGELHRRFPDNELYTREIARIDKGAH